jgi:hypothetical protein
MSTDITTWTCPVCEIVLTKSQITITVGEMSTSATMVQEDDILFLFRCLNHLAGHIKDKIPNPESEIPFSPWYPQIPLEYFPCNIYDDWTVSDNQSGEE